MCTTTMSPIGVDWSDTCSRLIPNFLLDSLYAAFRGPVISATALRHASVLPARMGATKLNSATRTSSGGKRQSSTPERSHALVLAASGLAFAQDWSEYQNIPDGFKIDFPGQPKIAETTWT